VTRIPFTPGKPIMVSAKINGGGSAQLMLDTRASVTRGQPRAGRNGHGERRPCVDRQGATGTADVLTVPVQSIEVGAARSGPLRVASRRGQEGDGLWAATSSTSSRSVSTARPGS
jgi:hypothetical protein